LRSKSQRWVRAERQRGWGAKRPDSDARGHGRAAP
jgi:hypothetical protein